MTGPLDEFFRREAGRCTARLIRVLGDIDLAEDAVAEAFAIAAEQWPKTGRHPTSPGGIATGDGLIDGVAAPGPPPVADVRCCWPHCKEAGRFLVGAASISMMGLGWWPRGRSRSCPPRLRFDRDDAAARGDPWAGCWPIITG